MLQVSHFGPEENSVFDVDEPLYSWERATEFTELSVGRENVRFL